jgi:hypothetical protein
LIEVRRRAPRVRDPDRQDGRLAQVGGSPLRHRERQRLAPRVEGRADEREGERPRDVEREARRALRGKLAP